MISERAKEWSMHYLTEKRRDIAQRSYKFGATEQQEKDIERAIAWVRYHSDNGGCSFDGWEESLTDYIKG